MYLNIHLFSYILSSAGHLSFFLSTARRRHTCPPVTRRTHDRVPATGPASLPGGPRARTTAHSARPLRAARPPRTLHSQRSLRPPGRSRSRSGMPPAIGPSRRPGPRRGAIQGIRYRNICIRSSPPLRIAWPSFRLSSLGRRPAASPLRHFRRLTHLTRGAKPAFPACPRARVHPPSVPPGGHRPGRMPGPRGRGLRRRHDLGPFPHALRRQRALARWTVPQLDRGRPAKLLHGMEPCPLVPASTWNRSQYHCFSPLAARPRSPLRAARWPGPLGGRALRYAQPAQPRRSRPRNGASAREHRPRTSSDSGRKPRLRPFRAYAARIRCAGCPPHAWTGHARRAPAAP